MPETLHCNFVWSILRFYVTSKKQKRITCSIVECLQSYILHSIMTARLLDLQQNCIVKLLKKEEFVPKLRTYSLCKLVGIYFWLRLYTTIFCHFHYIILVHQINIIILTVTSFFLNRKYRLLLVCMLAKNR